MQKAVIIFAQLILISHCAIFTNPSARGQASPPGSGSTEKFNSYQFFPTHGASEIEIEIRQKFLDFKRVNGKFYGNPDQEAYRQQIFEINSKQVEDFNNGPVQDWKKGVNKFSDMNDQQFRGKILMRPFHPTPSLKVMASAGVYPAPGIASAPKDWTLTFNSISWPVQDQGGCGSSWAFSAVGVIEANVALRRSKMIDKYSEQYLVDCISSASQCYGCMKGSPSNAMTYLGLHLGLPTSTSYKYTGMQGVCQTPRLTQYLRQPWVSRVPASQISSQIQTKTISVSLYADGWKTYGSGVYAGCTKSVGVTGVDHAAVLVGIDPNGNYKVRNSWGALWGEAGYMRINSAYDCGLAQYAYIPILI